MDIQICVPLILETWGARVASAGFALEYNCQVLHLPNGAQDNQPGSVPTQGQDVTCIVEEKGICQVQVAVNPPIQIPIPVIPDGDLVQMCFMVKPAAPDGCSDITSIPGSVDMGDDQGQNIPFDQPTDGGVLVGCPPTGPEICTGGIDEDCDGLIDCDDPDCLGDMSCYTDQFKCYMAKGKLVGEVVSLPDQFETKDMKVRKPTTLCYLVDKSSEGISDPAAHLTCSHVVDKKGQPNFQPRDVLGENQFGEQTLTTIEK